MTCASNALFICRNIWFNEAVGLISLLLLRKMERNTWSIRYVT
jgi:hypothetical protein